MSEAIPNDWPSFFLFSTRVTNEYAVIIEAIDVAAKVFVSSSYPKDSNQRRASAPALTKVALGLDEDALTK